jgi:tyrosinase
MTDGGALRVRKSLTDLSKKELEDLMRAWKGIQDLSLKDSKDPNGFFVIGGYHGEPFRGEGETDPSWWGGYCQHGNVLFPTWHRAYLLRLENALRSIPECENVTIPFWDECSQESLDKGIPTALTDEFFVFDNGDRIPNPLRSFTLPAEITDRVKDDPIVYSKPKGYETVRYPLSGLVGTEADRKATENQKKKYPDYKTNVVILNNNIKTWLNEGFVIGEGRPLGEIFSKFVQCLDAPDYTRFANRTSEKAWNKSHSTNLVSLESPHNFMHLAVGGFQYTGQGNADLISGANGDMGENDTAALDPIFFFHHCFIDYVFWIWQQRQGLTDGFSIDPSDPGTKYYFPNPNDPSSPDDPPPAGADFDKPLSLDTPLKPFVRPDGLTFTTSGCVNIEKQLGYKYGPGSLDEYAHPATNEALMAATAVTPRGRTVLASGIDRTGIRGSFLISAFATVDGKREHIGTEPVLSRWHVAGCMNCQNHLEATASFRLPPGARAEDTKVEVEVRTHQGLFVARPRGPHSVEALAAGTETETAPFKVEII